MRPGPWPFLLAQMRVEYLRRLEERRRPLPMIWWKKNWGKKLVYPTNLVSEFLDLLRPTEIHGELGEWRI